MTIEGVKVITSKEMRRIEEKAYSQGASDIQFMENAGNAIAEIVDDYLHSRHRMLHVSLFVGKGNNGGDAYAAGIKLLEKGIAVDSFHFYPFEECSPLCRKQHERFKKAGGKVHFILKEERIHFEHDGIILDGLVGTGFHGEVQGILAHAIKEANQASIPIIAIDIPSGVNGDTGEVASAAIYAAETIYLGLPKIGFFIGDGWNHVGNLIHADFGLDKKFIDEAQEEAYLLNEEQIQHCMPRMKRNRHKYDAGYVLAISGSLEMPGAAILASAASLRSGAGIVRLFHPENMPMAGMPPEIIREVWNLDKKKRIFSEAERADAVLIGPGLGRTKEVKKLLDALLERLTLPCIIDADALYFLAEHPKWKLPEISILTPHRKEMERLLSQKLKKETDQDFHNACQDFVDKKKVTLVLKGGPTFIFHPGTVPIIVPRGDPGMATAGAGDVLTGIIAALAAQGLEARAAAAMGVYLHGVAGETASFLKTPFCMIASDITDSLPEAFSHLT